MRGIAVAEVLLAKILDGRPASFVRMQGDGFVVSVDGRERMISRALWRRLPDLEVEGRGRGHPPVPPPRS